MTHFQLVAVSLFAASLVLANSQKILSIVRSGGAAVFRVFRLPSVVAEQSNVLGPQERVRDLVTVSELRDRLTAVGCTTGVDACTALLKAIVDHPTDCTK